MDAEAIRALRAFPSSRFQKGELIIRQGDAATHVFYLAEGVATRIGYTVRGDELAYGARMADGSASCLLGALSLYGVRHEHETSFAARSRCVCHVVPEAEFMAFLQEHPLVLNDLMYLAIRSYSSLDASFRGKMKGLAPARVASYLLERSHEAGGVRELDMRLNISEISREIGLHRITVSEIVHAFMDQGHVVCRGDTPTIASPDALREYVEGTKTLSYQ